MSENSEIKTKQANKKLKMKGITLDQTRMKSHISFNKTQYI